MHLIYIYEKEKNSILSLLHDITLWWGLGSQHLKWYFVSFLMNRSRPSHSVAHAMTNVHAKRLPCIFLFCYSDHESWPAYLQRHDRSCSPWAVCRVSSARSCLYTPQIVAIKSCPSMLLVHPDAEPLYGSTVVAYCRQCLMPVPFFL